MEHTVQSTQHDTVRGIPSRAEKLMGLELLHGWDGNNTLDSKETTKILSFLGKTYYRVAIQHACGDNGFLLRHSEPTVPTLLRSAFPRFIL